jgi:hypothetical protein
MSRILNTGLQTAVIRYGSACICIEFGRLEPDLVPCGQNYPSKGSKEMKCFEVLDVLFGGLETSHVAWTSFMEAYRDKYIFKFFIKRDFSHCQIFTVFGHPIPGSGFGPTTGSGFGSRTGSGSGPGIRIRVRNQI